MWISMFAHARMDDWVFFLLLSVVFYALFLAVVCGVFFCVFCSVCVCLLRLMA